ncbi:putative 3-methyladenine DNA glycosylase [Candidatus Zixiibacteriota bacterium]|nr:putative 3-methyladenine DNA glycosylase [candidate division Zixibacteria bacterium]
MSCSLIATNNRDLTDFKIKLDRDFYLRPTLDVAKDLIGKFLVFRTPEGILSARLVEVEAYIGEDDPACHAAVGKTNRNEVMFGPGGFSYIYFIYGMYHCLNVVTERESFPSAVLIRGAEPVEGLDIMRRHFPNPEGNRLTDGPGKLCKAFGLSRRENGLDLTGSKLYLEDRGYKPVKVERSRRIGIKKGVERKWRYFEPCPFVSVKLK